MLVANRVSDISLPDNETVFHNNINILPPSLNVYYFHDASSQVVKLPVSILYTADLAITRIAEPTLNLNSKRVDMHYTEMTQDLTAEGWLIGAPSSATTWGVCLVLHKS